MQTKSKVESCPEIPLTPGALCIYQKGTLQSRNNLWANLGRLESPACGDWRQSWCETFCSAWRSGGKQRLLSGANCQGTSIPSMQCGLLFSKPTVKGPTKLNGSSSLNPPDRFENLSLHFSDHSATNSPVELANNAPSSIGVGTAHYREKLRTGVNTLTHTIWVRCSQWILICLQFQDIEIVPITSMNQGSKGDPVLDHEIIVSGAIQTQRSQF